MNYFSKETDPKIDWDKIDMPTLERLDIARGKAGIPYEITRTYSTPEHSVSVGGTATDAHTDNPCKAFDIVCIGDENRAKILGSCWEVGFRRFGINNINGHIHVDDSDRPSPAIWIE